jgi:Sulfotransferase family
LLRDLLDGHPALVVLPSEGTFISSFEDRLRRLPKAARPGFLGREWLQRLANPINQEPYWLLGRSSATQSGYVDFVQALNSWWPVCAAHLAPTAPSWPLVTVALAYAHVTCGVSERTVRWVEKTPTNERHLERLWREYPHAKVIQIVRHPYAVLASSKAIAGGWRRRGWTANTALRNLDVSYRAALAHQHDPHQRYLLIRYEELLENLTPTADRIANFLDIEPLPILQQPRVAGQPAASNSSFDVTLPKGQIQTGARHRDESLSAPERAQVAAIVGESASALGYKVDSLPAWRRALLRAIARMR